MLYAALLQGVSTPAFGPTCWTILCVLGGVIGAMALYIVKLQGKMGRLHKEIARIHEERVRYLESQIRLIQTLKSEVSPK